jgi:hypothetical protein
MYFTRLDSKNNNAICATTRIINKDVDRNGPVFPGRINKCTAIMFFYTSVHDKPNNHPQYLQFSICNHPNNLL